MIKAIAIDADGVIFRETPFFVFYAATAGIKPEVIDEFFNGPYKQCQLGRADLFEILTEYKHKLKWERAVEELISEWFDYENVPDANLMEVIQNIRSKGVITILATDQEKYRTEYFKTNNNFEDYFDEIAASYAYGHLKTENEYYAHILNKYSLKASELLFWDDSIKNLNVARKLGIRGRLFRSSDHIISELKTLC